MVSFKEIKPRTQWVKRVYLQVLLWITGRAIQAAARIDPEIQADFATMPRDYSFCLTAFPSGPSMVVAKTNGGKVSYLGQGPRRVDLTLSLKSLDHFFQLFTFQENTPTATARDRLFTCGDVPHTCAVVRILDRVQVYLLPRPIAQLAVKRYPKWSLKRRTLDRARIYLGALWGV